MELAESSVAQVRKSAMIDHKSMADYKREIENQRQQLRNSTEAEIFVIVTAYIKRRLTGIVDEECSKRVMDLTTVGLSIMSSSVICFSGVAIVVAATVLQCLNFAITLGLIPIMNVRSVRDLVTMSQQIGTTIKHAGKYSLIAGVETAVLELLKRQELDKWLWDDILRDILVEMIGESSMDALWIFSPLLAAPKYMLHRHLIKKMYRKLGDKAEIVHRTWVEHHCVITTVQTSQTTVVSHVDPDGNVQGAYIQTQETVCATMQVGADTQQPPTSGFRNRLRQKFR